MSNLTNKAHINAHADYYGSNNEAIFYSPKSLVSISMEEELASEKFSLLGENVEYYICNSANMANLPGDDDDDLDDDEDDEIDLDEELEIETDEVDVESIEIDDEDPDDIIEDDDDELDDDDIL